MKLQNIISVAVVDALTLPSRIHVMNTFIFTKVCMQQRSLIWLSSFEKIAQITWMTIRTSCVQASNQQNLGDRTDLFYYSSYCEVHLALTLDDTHCSSKLVSCPISTNHFVSIIFGFPLQLHETHYDVDSPRGWYPIISNILLQFRNEWCWDMYVCRWKTIMM